MSNKSETKGQGWFSNLLNFLPWLNKGDTNQSLMASKEPVIDRQSRQNDRNLTSSVIGIVGLLTYLGNVDLSNFSLEFLFKFGALGSDLTTNIKVISEIISTSWSSITAVVAVLLIIALVLFCAFTQFRNACINHKAQSIEASHFNQTLAQAQKEAEQAKAEAAKYKERAELAEADAAKIRKELEEVKSAESKIFLEQTKAEIELARARAKESIAVKFAYDAISNSINHNSGAQPQHFKEE